MTIQTRPMRDISRTLEDSGCYNWVLIGSHICRVD